MKPIILRIIEWRAVIFFSIIIFGCQSKERVVYEDSDNDKELELKERELEAKEFELKLKEMEVRMLESKLNEKPLELKEIYQEVKKAVYLVYTSSENGRSQGSAFVISSNGIAISNYHVFENASDAILYNDYGKEFLITDILRIDKENDYVIFRIGDGTQLLPHLKIAEKKPEVGEPCFAVGNPRGLTQTLSNGLVSGIRESGRLIQTTTEITHGSSGGPLFNQSGEVIGITSSGMKEANLNFAIDINSLDFSNIREPVKVSNYLPENEIIAKLKRYYGLLNSGDYNGLEGLYASRLSRFYSKFDISKEEVIRIAKGYDQKFGVRDKTTSIRWSTFKLVNSSYGEKIASFVMDYSFVKVSSNKKSEFVLNMTVHFDANGKISCVYEDILKRK